MSKISVIIPVYNTEAYLPRCIESVIGQTYRDWELLLVDDGSTDGSGDICDRYAKQDGRIKVMHNRNQGPAVSRENGIKNSKGGLIMFADSDDWLDKDMLRIMKEEMEASGAGMICCLYQDVRENGKVMHPYAFREERIECMNVRECMYQIHHTRYLTGALWGKLYRRELFQDIDFCRDVTIGEDYSMIIQLVEKAGHVRMISKEFYFRSVRKGSISHGGYTKRHRKAFDNYMRLRLRLLKDYPELSSDIIAFHTEYEMAVITAMCRNDCYDKEVIAKLKNDLRVNIKNTLGHAIVPLYMKGCAVLIAYAHPVFIVLFRLLYHLTGR